MSFDKAKGARELAFLALLRVYKGGEYLDDIFSLMGPHEDKREIALAKEIAFGVLRKEGILCEFARSLTKKGELQVGKKVQLLLCSALYQWVYMDRVPLFAIVDETVSLAGRYVKTHKSFMNALLRELSRRVQSRELPSLSSPLGEDNETLAKRYSVPVSFVERLREGYPWKKVKEALQVFSNAPKIVIRARSWEKCQKELEEALKGQTNHPSQERVDLTTPLTPMPPAGLNCYLLQDTSLIPLLGKSANVYIQNITPLYLLDKLAKELAEEPKRILDLCAAPGGKLLALADRFPEATLIANDPSPKRSIRLQENITKYGLQVDLRGEKGEKFIEEKRFDLIVLDVPCSNSGVLHKRVEARLRLEESIPPLKDLQRKLVRQSVDLLEVGGRLWYMTCSILKEENAEMIQFCKESLGLEVVEGPYTVLPNALGWDGGFAVALAKKDERGAIV